MGSPIGNRQWIFSHCHSATTYRLILFYRTADVIEIVFAEHRSIVYEVFAEALRKKLSRNS
jgi:hypothetical protein